MLHKNRSLPQLLVVFTAIFLFTTLLQPTTCSAVVVWQDDFNDGNHDGWAIYQGDMGIISNALVVTAAFWSFARYSSHVAYGYWSFDVLSEDAPDNHSFSEGSHTSMGGEYSFQELL